MRGMRCMAGLRRIGHQADARDRARRQRQLEDSQAHQDRDNPPKKVHRSERYLLAGLRINRRTYSPFTLRAQTPHDGCEFAHVLRQPRSTQ